MIKLTQLSVLQAEVQSKEQKFISGGIGDLFNIFGTDIYYLLKVSEQEIPWDQKKYPDSREFKSKFYGAPD